MRKSFLSLVFVVLVGLMAFPSSSLAQQVIDAAPMVSGDPDLAGTKSVSSDRISDRGQGRAIAVLVELEQPSATQAFLNAGGTVDSASPQAVSATQARIRQIDRAQRALLRPLAARGATVIYRAQRIYNGIAVLVEPSRINELLHLPGVKGVRPIETHTIDNATGVPLIGAPQIWSGTGLGQTGKGIKIAIIDTGIDYLHANFGGPGDAAKFAAHQAGNDDLVITDTLSVQYFGANGPKVKGGYDFAGDDYNADPSDPAYQPIPRPDPDPIDCNGHGSHVAGSAAGLGVNADGTSYAGPFTAATPFESLRIGPGAAPEADLYALRVFGCDGSTNVTDQAIEWAMDPNGDGNFSDRMDVINMSLGSSYGSPNSASAIASDAAAAVGVIVVASAGNSSDTTYISGSPGSSLRTITVAGVTDATSILDGFTVTAPAAIAGNKPGSISVNFPWRTPPTGRLPVTAPLYYTTTYPLCAAPTAAQRAVITGTIVLINWADGQCGSGARSNNAAAAGARGLIIADNSDVFDLLLAGNATLPVMSTPKAVGAQLAAAIQGGDTVTVTLRNDLLNSVADVNPAQVDSVYLSTSRGPRRADSFLKPDIAAPAVSVFSAAVGTGAQGASFNGTSMAAPHVAGMMALLRQLHPTWSVEELKALAMNNASFDVFTGFNRTGAPIGPGRIGAGRASAINAASASVIAYNAADLGAVSVSFGQVNVPVTGTVSAAKPVRIVNKSSGPATYSLVYEPRVDQPGVSYTVAPTTVTVPGGGSTVVTVTMSATGAQMGRGTPDPSRLFAPGDLRHFIAEEAGYLNLVPAVMTFSATINGAQEVPPTPSPVTGSAILTYTAATGKLDYQVVMNQQLVASGPGAHIHRAPAGANGPVIASILPTNPYTFTPGVALTGSLDLPFSQLSQLVTGGHYFNFHNTTFPGGEVRGQIIASGNTLRVPVHSVPRVVATLGAVQEKIVTGSAITGTVGITLTGAAMSLESGLPAVITAFELQGIHPRTTEGYTSSADLEYIGIYSNFKQSPNITNTTIYFGLSTYEDWNVGTFADVEFDIYIDTNSDGTDDFVLYNSNAGAAASAPNDIFVTTLVNLSTGRTVPGLNFTNVVTAGLDTGLFNNNVIVLPVNAAALGLKPGHTTINYSIVTFQREVDTVVDVSPVLTYDIARPGLTFPGALVGPGHVGAPGVMPVAYDTAALRANDSFGLLLMHHHNGGANADFASSEAIIFNQPYEEYLPLIRR